MLVKVTMGATSVAPSEFMQQTQEVLNRLEAERKLGSDGLTHPETYIRAFAIDRFANHRESASDPIAKLIEGTLDMSTLDLLQQQFVSHATRQLLHRIFKLKAMRSELMLSHARLYFEDFSLSEIDTESSCLELTSLIEDHQKKEAVSSYFAYVLLDFATADRSLDEFPLANSMQVAEELGIKDVFITIARKELKLRKNQIEQCDRDKEAMLQNAESIPSQP